MRAACCDPGQCGAGGLELGCHFVVLGLGTILLYSLLTGFNRVTATGAAWGTVGVAVVLVYARTAQIAEGQRRESATSGVLSRAAG